MAKFVKDIVDLVEFLAGKNIATKYPPEKISLALYEVSLSLFVEYLDHYGKTQKINRFLMPFLKQEQLTLTSGKVDIPTDFEHVRYVDLPADQANSTGDIYKTGQEVKVIEDGFWNGRVTRALNGPDRTPIMRFEDDGTGDINIQVLPVSIAKINLYYFKKVIRPVYAYTSSGTRYIYDDANSVDVEWSPQLFPQLRLKTLESLGINLREQQVIQYTELLKAQEGNK